MIGHGLAYLQDFFLLSRFFSKPTLSPGPLFLDNSRFPNAISIKMRCGFLLRASPNAGLVGTVSFETE